MNRRTISARAVAAAARSAVALESLELRRLLSYDLAGTYIDTANGAAYEMFGSSVATQGDLALIGSPGRNASITTDGENWEQIDTTRGQATLIDTTTGQILRTFHNPIENPATEDKFGAAVAFVDGKIAITSVGSRSIYIYDDYSDDTPDRTYHLNAGSHVVGFGSIISVQGDDLLVGVGQWDSATSNGAILRYNLDNPVNDFEQIYFNADPGITPVDQFGYNFTSDGEYIYVRAVDDNTAKVVVMDNNGDPVTVYHSVPGDTSFGYALATAEDATFGNTVLIGDTFNGTVKQVDTAGNLIQTFVIFQEPEGWPASAFSIQVSGDKLFASNPFALTLDESWQLVSAPGSVYVFDLASGAFEEKIANPDALPVMYPEEVWLDDQPDTFGFILAPLPGGKILISALTANNEKGIDAGTIHVYAPQAAETENQAPANVAIAGESSAVRQQTINFTGSFTDADLSDTHTVSWDFGDGNVIAAHSTADAGALAVSHAYETAGTFTITMTITDSANASASTQFIVNVAASSVTGGTLNVGGTGSADNITLAKNNSGATVVTINGVATTFTGGRVVIYGGAGDDIIDASKTVNAILEVYGGAGNDVIKGGGLGDILVGGDGNDDIAGGKGRDLIIGGAGADTIIGDQDNDILIAGNTVHDGDPAALNSILTTWNSGLSYTALVDALRSTALRPGVDVLDDGVADHLTGSAGQDWFVFAGDNDIITDMKKDETATDIA